MNRIASITEAYSMQPKTMRVGDRFIYGDPVVKSNVVTFKGDVICTEIIYHADRIAKNNKQGDYNIERYYEGIGENGEKLFRYQADSVNVHYY